ncbi:hypothetical protein GCM10022631_05260 [Deinococcus rubellus]
MTSPVTVGSRWAGKLGKASRRAGLVLSSSSHWPELNTGRSTHTWGMPPARAEALFTEPQDEAAQVRDADCAGGWEVTQTVQLAPQLGPGHAVKTERGFAAPLDSQVVQKLFPKLIHRQVLHRHGQGLPDDVFWFSSRAHDH